MDVIFEFQGLHFSWNSEKGAANATKHGLTFENACEVFLDPLMQLWDGSANGEQRFVAVGQTSKREVLYVVHIEFFENHFRIISARFATRLEIARYEDNG